MTQWELYIVGLEICQSMYVVMWSTLEASPRLMQPQGMQCLALSQSSLNVPLFTIHLSPAATTMQTCRSISNYGNADTCSETLGCCSGAYFEDIIV